MQVIVSKVYYTKNIDADSLIKLYKALRVNLEGNIGIKVPTWRRGY